MRPCKLSVRASLFFLMLVPLLLVDAAYATVRFVTPTGTGTGTTSWANASSDLQGMINDTGATEVWVAAGTYKPGTSRTDTYTLKKDVKVYGGFVGDEPNTNEGFQSRNPYLNVTTLSGDIGTIITATDNVYHVVTAPALVGDFISATTILDGFTIRDGYADGTAPYQSGAGIYIDNALPSIVRCTFIANHATYGGAMHLTKSPLQGNSVQVVNCAFDGNVADQGGAIYTTGTTQPDSSSAHCMNCLFINNHANSIGGAIHSTAYSGTVLRNCTVSRNTTSGTVAGISHIITNNCLSTTTGETHLENSIVHNNGGGSESDQVYGPTTADYSCIQNLGGDACRVYNSCISSNPSFVNSTSDFHLQSGSPCINQGSNSRTDYDTYDVNQDDDLGEATPDLDHNVRIAGCVSGSGVVDMGAYEYGAIACKGDVNLSGEINIDDLLAVINSWGACTCPADIVPYPCGSGSVDIDDLLEVINHWGACPLGTSDSEEDSMPSSIQDCIDEATRHYTPHTTAWETFLERCTDALCAKHLIDCD